jgi:hypothetical protein
MKHLLKYALIGFASLAVLVGVVIFIFGGKENLVTEVPTITQPNLVEAVPADQAPSITEAKNVTESLAKEIAKKIIEKNPNGPTLVDSKNQIASINPDELVNQVIADAIKNFRPEALRPAISRADIRIGDNNSIEALNAYYISYKTAINSNLSTLSLNQDSPEQTDFTALVAGFNKAFTDLKTIVVPESLVALHLKELILLGTQKNIWLLIKNYQADPVQAMLAMQYGDVLMNEVLGIRDQYASFAIKNKVNY